MAVSSTCTYCKDRKGKRLCPALGGLICSVCCGRHRIREIECPECQYLGNEAYQERRRMARDLAEEMHAVRPDVCGMDALAASPEASHFTALLESTLCINCLDHGLDDADVLVALKAIYRNVYKHEDSRPPTVFAKNMICYIKEMVGPRFEGSVPLDLQEKIILRLMLSVKNIGGGPFGDRGYINYVKNNILSSAPEGKYVKEFADGTRVYEDIPR